MKTFVFESYEFAPDNLMATFRYSFDHKMCFTEEVQFEQSSQYNEKLLEKALFLAFIITGVSYYKLFPGAKIAWQSGAIDTWQSEFLNKVYQEGLGQFAFENELTREDLAHFTPTINNKISPPLSYQGKGILALQSGGKDSLLTASLLSAKKRPFDAFYISNSSSYPAILNRIGATTLNRARRYVDIAAIKEGIANGGRNGHVPVTYIVLSFALIQAILLNKKTILASIGHEGEEVHAWIEDLPISHQWSKTWQAELLLSEYVERYISPDLIIGSPLRQYSELRIAELFVKASWEKFGHAFSSCNLINYKQGTDNTELKWCTNCPKCANSYLLLAAFLEADELQSIFNNQDLFVKPSLQDIFKGLLGIEGAIKPFECVGEVAELRLAYHMAQKRGGYRPLAFKVPASSDYDYMQIFPHQAAVRAVLE